MKKVVFAIQLFSLMALFPVYVIVELNHGTGSLPVKVFSPDLMEKQEKTDIHLSSIDMDTHMPLIMVR